MSIILILSGSPRKNGNSERLANAFAMGAAEAGHTVHHVRIADKPIQGCRACNTCWKTERACSFRDGFTDLEPLLEQADTLALATPVYWFGMPSQLKAAIDKLYAYTSDNCKRPLAATRSYLLATGEGDQSVFGSMITMYKEIAAYLEWQNDGILTVPGVNKEGDIDSTGALKQARDMGRSVGA